jgi:formylglycine-generating enzyme required for sulfatase activity
VEDVSWLDCQETMRRLGLLLPTEAQWEYATRAGTDSVWWTGNERGSWEGMVNLGDAAPDDTTQRMSRNDGWQTHAPVGWYPPNAFGLHEVMGNVAEWCRDGMGDYRLDVSPGDGELHASDTRHRANRGGDGQYDSTRARSAAREWNAPEYHNPWIGLRPSRRVETR